MNISDVNLEPLVAKAIMDTITPEKREELITNAITALLDKKTSSSYNAPSHLQAAFDSAVRSAAEKIAMTALTEDPEFQGKVKKLFADAAEKLFAEGMYGQTVEKIAQKMAKGLTEERY